MLLESGIPLQRIFHTENNLQGVTSLKMFLRLSVTAKILQQSQSPGFSICERYYFCLPSMFLPHHFLHSSQTGLST